MKTPYRFVKRKNKPYIQVTFRHIPGRWFSTGTTSMIEAVRFADDEMRRGGLGSNVSMPTLNEFASGMFKPLDPLGVKKRNEARNLRYSSSYYEQHQGRLDNHILPTFGHHLIDSITDVAIEDWLLTLNVKNSTLPLSDDSRNKVLICFRIVLHEAKRRGYIEKNPAEEVRLINAVNKQRETINKGELEILFPYNRKDLLRIWLTPMWAGYFLVMRDTGFRPGEVAGLQKNNYFPSLHGIYTQQSVDYRFRTIKQSIKTSDKGQKYKVGMLSDLTCKILDEIGSEMSFTDFFFTINRRLIIPEVANKHFKGAAKRAGINLDGRTQYSFRHSFETSIAGKVENKVLLELMAHTSFRHEYDHRSPENILKQLQPVREILEDGNNV